MKKEKRLIDANALADNWFYTNDTGTKVVELLEIEQAPTVDAVEVVRCKDCLYYSETIGKDSGKHCGYGSCYCTSAIITGIVYDEDFCSYGERKDNANSH